MAKFLTEIQFTSSSLIETPESEFVTLYLNTDGYLYVKFANGSEARLTT